MNKPFLRNSPDSWILCYLRSTLFLTMLLLAALCRAQTNPPTGVLAAARILGSGAGCNDVVDSIRFTFGYWLGVSGPTHGVFDQFLLTTNDVGKVFTIARSDDPDFAFLESTLTNGISDSIGDYIQAGPCGFSESTEEARYFSPLPASGNNVDFAGFHIDNFVLQVDGLTFAHTGQWTDMSWSLLLFVNSEPWSLPGIWVAPQDQTADVDSTVEMNVSAIGIPPLAYQWFFNGTNLLAGATGSHLVLPNVQPSDSGAYTVVVTNAYGAATSLPGILTIRTAPPAIVTSPTSQTVDVGGSADFLVTAAGSPPLVYQWFFNGIAIDGASSSSLELTNLQLSMSGTYEVVVTNIFGAATSAPAQLSVYSAPGYAVLHHFSGPAGAGPWGRLVSAGSALYGTTRYSTNHGTVFKINTDGTGFTVLHDFTGSDGSDPMGALALADATLYGTTQNGGISTDPGTVFSISTDGGDFATLKDFGYGGGRWPSGNLVISGTTLYGTTCAGGSAGNGTVFKLQMDGTGYSTLHDFTGYPNDGRWPDGALLLSGSTLYGATPLGGGYGPPEGYGTLFKIQTDGTGYSILRQFTGSDGIAPYGGLVLSGTTLYGITEGGYPVYDGGTVFRINADGTGYTVLHTFGGPPADGAVPCGGLVLSGNTLFGATTEGGSHGYSPSTYDYGYGTVFKIHTDGTGYTLLKEFAGDDGARPYAGVLLHGTTLYGTTTSGGFSNNGVVFSVPLPMPNAVTVPANQTAERRSVVAFDVRTEPDPSQTYQWFFNGTNALGDPTTNSGLRLTDVGFSEAGSYSVVVRNDIGAVTSAPAALSVIPPVERRWVPGLTLTGEVGLAVNLEAAGAVAPLPNWEPLDRLVLTNQSQWYFDLSAGPVPQRFYRAWQFGSSSVSPGLDIHLIPALTLTGALGSTVRIERIDRFGPTDAWYPLVTLTLTNTSQLYFDTSVVGQPPRLWRVLPP